MTQNTTKLEGLKARYDLLKHLSSISLIMIGFMVTIVQTLLKNHGHEWIVIVIIGCYISTAILCVIGSWGITNIMRSENNDSKIVNNVFVLALLLFVIGCAVMALFLSISIN